MYILGGLVNDNFISNRERTVSIVSTPLKVPNQISRQNTKLLPPFLQSSDKHTTHLLKRLSPLRSTRVKFNAGLSTTYRQILRPVLFPFGVNSQS